MTIKEGDTLPEVTLHHMTEKGPTPITSSELFGGKKTVLFAVPGAFTPGCSMQHLPGFVTNSQEILDNLLNLLNKHLTVMIISILSHMMV